MDDNSEILSIIVDRMEKGQQSYGHGVRTGDDTRTWGTKQDSWVEMAMEEIMDAMIYMAAQMLRILKSKV